MLGAVTEGDTTEACLSISLMLNPFLKRKANTKTTNFREIPTLPFKKFFSYNLFTNFLTFMGPCIVRIFQYIYIEQDATLHSLFYLETALHVSGGTATHHQERKQLYLQHLVFVRLLPTAIAAGSSNGLTNTRCCRYSCLRS